VGYGKIESKNAMPDDTPDSKASAPVGADSNVWPPAPITVPFASVPFRNINLVIRGQYSVSDFRVGAITVNEEGVTIRGKSVWSGEKQFWVVLLSCFLFLWPAVVMLLERLRFPRESMLAWDQVDVVVLDCRRRRVGVAYKESGKNGKVRRYVLASSLAPSEFDDFDRAVRKIGRATSVDTTGTSLYTPFGSPAGYAVLVSWAIMALYLCVAALNNR